MITKTISVSYEDVQKSVILNTNYVGAGVPDDRRVFASEHDNALFLRLWGETAEAAADRVKEFQDGSFTPLEEVAEDDTVRHYCLIPLSLPSNWNTNYDAQMQSSAKSFFVNSITARWFGISKKDETAYYEKLAIKSEAELRGCVYARKKPKLCDI